ncbi:MAG: hypothetical protein V4629_11460 [Pseudomonadota bacterium]
MRNKFLKIRKFWKGTSLIPVLILSALVAIIAAPTLFQLQMNQRMRANDLFRMQVYQNTNSELFTQYKKYQTDTDVLGKAMLEGKQDTTHSEFFDTKIMKLQSSVSQRDTRQNCTGYSSNYKCAIFQIAAQVEEPATRARSHQYMIIDAPMER